MGSFIRWANLGLAAGAGPQGDSVRDRLGVICAIALVLPQVLVLDVEARPQVGIEGLLDDWPMFGYDGRRSHTSSANLTNATAHWSRDLGASVDPAIIAGGLVFVTSRADVPGTDVRLHALELVTGQEVWRQAGPGPASLSTPAFDPDTGRVWAVLGRSLRAFDSLTGSPVCTAISDWSWFSARPVVSDGRLYLAGGDLSGPYSPGGVFAIDGRTCEVLWFYPTGSSINVVTRGGPYVIAGAPQIGGAPSKIFVLDKDTGAVVWWRSIGGEIGGVPSVFAETLYVPVGGFLNGSVIAFNLYNGAVRWWYNDTNLYGGIYGTPVEIGSVVFAQGYRGLYYLDKATGVPLAPTVTPCLSLSPPGSPAVASGLVAIGAFPCQGGRLFVIDPVSRVGLKEVPAPGASGGSPAVVPGSVALNGPLNGVLYAFRTDIRVESPAGSLPLPPPSPDPLPEVGPLGNYDVREIPYDFQDISGTGFNVALQNDMITGPIPVGFTFLWYNATVTQIWVSSNGFLRMSPPPPGSPWENIGCCSGRSLPTDGEPFDLVSGWWEDLNPQLGGSVRYKTAGATPDRVFTLQFSSIQHQPGGNPVTMQFKLFEQDGAIEVHYLSAPTDGGDHTIGVQDRDGSRSTMYYYGNDRGFASHAIRFGRTTGVTG